jgi:hypothetical protein
MNVRFIGPAAVIGGRLVSSWNRTWLALGATELAVGDDTDGPRAMAAQWRVGSGRVAAVAWRDANIDRLADLIAQPPRDPRFKVSWQTGPLLHVAVDAVDGKTYLNNLKLTLELWAQDSLICAPQEIRQTGPGWYELTGSAPSEPVIAIVRNQDRLLDRMALGGWYRPEFAAVGEDRQALESLAKTSGGQVIDPTQTGPIQFNWPRRPYRLTSWLCVCGAVCLAAGLLIWQRR